MPEPTFLRLVPPAAAAERARASAQTAAEAAVVEAALVGLPPGGRVLAVGSAGWLAEALGALGVEVACVGADALGAAAGDPLAGLPADGLPPLTPGDADLAVVPEAALGEAPHAVVLALADRLALGGRLLLVAGHPAAPDARRSLGAWVRLVAAAGLTLCDAAEPDVSPRLLLLVAER